MTRFARLLKYVYLCIELIAARTKHAPCKDLSEVLTMISFMMLDHVP